MSEGGTPNDGRGRLSSIDLLPDEAEPDIVWANEQLRDRSMPSNAILIEFNKRLADRAIAPISKSAWGRYSVRKALLFRKHDDARRMSAELVAQLGGDGADDVTVMLAEMIKVAIFARLENGELGTKEILEISRGLSSVVSAQKGSAEHRRKLQDEIELRLKKAAEAIADVGAKGGVGADTLKKITSLLTTGAI